jgi:hypothetical protein
MNRLASSAESVISSGSGQLRPAAWKRLIVARTVDAAAPIRRATSRIGRPPTNFNRRTSRTWRMIVLSAGIRSLLLEQPKERDLSRPAGAPTAPGEIILEWWATSSRNGDIIPEWVGGIIPESFRNHGRLASESPTLYGLPREIPADFRSLTSFAPVLPENLGIVRVDVVQPYRASRWI